MATIKAILLKHSRRGGIIFKTVFSAKLVLIKHVLKYFSAGGVCESYHNLSVRVVILIIMIR